VAEQKYFLVSYVIQPAKHTEPIELMKIEGVFSKALQVIS